MTEFARFCRHRSRPENRKDKEQMEWRETYPPIQLDRNDPRYWDYNDNSLMPGRIHQETSLAYGAVKIDERIIAVREYDGRYWPVFKHWHAYLERMSEPIVILEKVA